MRRIQQGMFFLCSMAMLLSAVFASTPGRYHVNQKNILANAPGLSAETLRYAVKGFDWANRNHEVRKPNILTVVDFTLPSFKKRLWVINLKTGKTLIHAYTTQGKASGLVYARHFSNQFKSDQSSLGVYKITGEYVGEHGPSLHLLGLEKGINNNAEKRAIVIHSAWYATPEFVARYHRTGRSWGCFAIDPKIRQRFIQLTENGSILFAYAKAERRDRLI